MPENAPSPAGAPMPLRHWSGERVRLRGLNPDDWPLFAAWEIKGTYPLLFNDPKVGEAAKALFDDAQAMLDQLRLVNPKFDAAHVEPRRVLLVPTLRAMRRVRSMSAGSPCRIAT